VTGPDGGNLREKWGRMWYNMGVVGACLQCAREGVKRNALRRHYERGRIGRNA
jgi:hypothetical protein